MLLTILSAGLLYLSFPNVFCIYGYGLCIWIFAVPFLLALHGQSLKKRLLLGAVFGFCGYGLVTWGLIIISPLVFFGFTVALGIQTLIFACLARPVEKCWVQLVFFPSAWAASELIRNQLLGGYSVYISHAHAFCPMMLKLYGYCGCLGMSFIIFFVNNLMYLGVIYPQRRFKCLLAAVIIFLSVVGAGLINIEHPSPGHLHIRVAVVQANISPFEKADINYFDHIAARHLHLTQEAFKEDHPDLVVWPETAYPDDLLKDTRWRPLIFEEAKYRHKDILLGMAPIIDGKEYNTALLINAQGRVGGMYHKQLLVPFAEKAFSAGHQLGILASDGLRIGVMICSESFYPYLARRLKQQGAQFLVEMSNDGWFTTKELCMLHAQAAVMRAVENRIWVVRAANTGFSFAVDPDGHIYTSGNLKLGHEGFGIFDIIN